MSSDLYPKPTSELFSAWWASKAVKGSLSIKEIWSLLTPSLKILLEFTNTFRRKSTLFSKTHKIPQTLVPDDVSSLILHQLHASHSPTSTKTDRHSSTSQSSVAPLLWPVLLPTPLFPTHPKTSLCLDNRLTILFSKKPSSDHLPTLSHFFQNPLVPSLTTPYPHPGYEIFQSRDQVLVV